MAFSATDWAYRLSDWSGSAQGNKSWSALGTSTRIGQYYNYLVKPSYYSTTLNYVYVGFSPTTNARNPDPFYAYAYYYDYYYAEYYDSLCGYVYIASQFSTANPFNYYQPQGQYSGVATYVPSPASSYSPGSPSGYTQFVGGGAGGVTAWSPATFYNYSPWGAPPYSAGANIFIGAGSSPFSAYPYQFVHS
jgi:hypothetical protein